MRLNIVSMQLYKLTNGELQIMANAILNSASGNSNFTSPTNPTLIQLGLLITNFSDALSAWGSPGNRGSHLDHVQLIATRNALRAGLTGLALYAENVAQGSRDILATIDWPLRAINTPTGVLGAIRNLRQLLQSNVLQGTLKLGWDKPLNTANIRINGFFVFRSNSSDFSTAVQVATVTKTSFIDTNPGAGIRYYWIIPFNAYGNGVTSSPCPAMAMLVSS